MPSFQRVSSRTTSPIRTGLSDVKMVGFPPSPVTGVSRPLNNTELWALYNFEMHSRSCAACYDPYSVHKSGGQLCHSGHQMAQHVAKYISSKYDGRQVYSAGESDQSVHVEIPAGYDNIRSLLRVTERSLRHRRQRPIISYDPNSQDAPRKSAKAGATLTKSHRRKSVIVNWPGHEINKPLHTVESVRQIIVPSASNHPQRRQSSYSTYNVEVREPARRPHRYSTVFG